MQTIEKLQAIMRRLLDIGLLLAAIGVLAGVIFGSETPFLGSNVAVNFNNLLAAIGGNSVAAMFAFITLAWLFTRRGGLFRTREGG